ncbi:hypothetical protein C1668_27105, partial [Klebsiella pneumoniae]
HSTGARQGVRIPTRHRRPASWADSHTAPAPGKVGGFPHGTGARQGGRISTQHRRPARWADSHTAPAPGKVGGFPHGTGARQGGRISITLIIPLCYLWIVQLSGALAVTVRCPP